MALFAAALDTRIEVVATWGAPASFRSLIVRDPAYPPSAFLFDVLRHFDLPEVTAAIAPRSTIIANACDGKGQPLSQEQLEGTYQYTREVYEGIDSLGRCRLLAGDCADHRSSVCDWLGAQ